MHKWTLSVVFAGLFCLPAVAQDHPKVELFGGYQYTHLEPSLNAHGWNASITGNMNHWFGLAADFSGAYKSGFKFHTYMFGPVIAARQSERVTPFVHALFGGAHASNGVSFNGFSMALGGGLDVKVNNNVAVRFVQADWLLTRFEGITDKKNVRVSTGIVFRF